MLHCMLQGMYHKSMMEPSDINDVCHRLDMPHPQHSKGIHKIG